MSGHDGEGSSKVKGAQLFPLVPERTTTGWIDCASDLSRRQTEPGFFVDVVCDHKRTPSAHKKQDLIERFWWRESGTPVRSYWVSGENWRGPDSTYRDTYREHIRDALYETDHDWRVPGDEVWPGPSVTGMENASEATETLFCTRCGWAWSWAYLAMNTGRPDRLGQILDGLALAGVRSVPLSAMGGIVQMLARNGRPPHV